MPDPCGKQVDRAWIHATSGIFILPKHGNDPNVQGGARPSDPPSVRRPGAEVLEAEAE